MGIWSTIGEAAATMGGDKEGATGFRKTREDQVAQTHADLEAKTHAILDQVKGLQERRAGLPPGDPQAAQIDKSLAEHQQAFTDLYHPTKNPGAIQHLGRFLKKHIAGKQPAPLPKSNAVTPERMGRLQMSVPVAGQTPAIAPPEQNPYALKVKNLEAIGVPHDEAVRIATGQKPLKPAGAEGETKPAKQTSDERKRADFAEWKKSHPEFKGTFEEWAYKETHPPKAPKAPTAPHLTPAQNSAQKDYLAADKLSRVADAVAKNPNDAVNQKRLAVALERISAGRFTTQALDYIIKAGWGNTVEQWANNPTTGALPTDVMRQLVDGAHQNLAAAKAELDEADRLAPKLPTTPAEAKKRIKGASAESEDDEFLKKF